jgi:phospholipase D1/2
MLCRGHSCAERPVKPNCVPMFSADRLRSGTGTAVRRCMCFQYRGVGLQGSLIPAKGATAEDAALHTILVEGRTVLCLRHARRVAILNDAANYFEALRRCLLQAQNSVFIVGWDVHSRTRLVGPTNRADDGYPEELGAFLESLLQQRSGLRIHLLIWNSPILYAGEREWFSASKFARADDDRLTFCFDNCLPIGSSQHQKIVVVDDRVAFSGGCDLTMRRWDTNEHAVDQPGRLDPDGVRYAPFHDVQMMVDGDAALSLAEIVRDRWRCARCAAAPAIQPVGDPWPDRFAATFENVMVGVSRTEPSRPGRPAVYEVAQLFLASIMAAERVIYIENQFLSDDLIARKLAERLQSKPELELLLIAPKTHASWIEARTMRNGRLEFMKVLEEAGVSDRVRLLYPKVADGNRTEAVMVHSKVMIVDDRILRVGSANLNHRSMGADTECDLVIEARSEGERRRIATIRNDLLGHFCGVSQGAVDEQLKGDPSFLRAATVLAERGHSLNPVEDGTPDPQEVIDFVTPVADPRRPLGLERVAAATFPAWLKLVAVVVALCGLAAIWRFTPLYRFAQFDVLLDALRAFEGSPVAPVVIVAAFVVLGLVMFPVTVLIAVTAAALGPWLGFGSAAVGAIASASVVYMIGHFLGIEPVKRMLGPRLTRIQRKIVGHGVISVAMIRMVPVAPFTLVNLAAGASGIKFGDFVVGTVLGMAPGLIAMSAFGAQLADILRHPSWSSAALLLLAIAVWLVVSLAAQFVVTWLGRRT